MLTALVRSSLAAEFAAYVVLGAWLHGARGWSLQAVVAATLACAFGTRLALVCLTSFLGWWHRSPRAPGQRLGPWGTLRLLAGEYRALLVDNFYYLPLESLALRPDPASRPGAGMPVVLVHGYLSNRGYFSPMVRWLEARGVAPIHVPNFTSAFSTIEGFAEELAVEIERIATASGHGRVILVCHSMGGLAARRYLQAHGESRVARLVTIASPHHGTAQAVLGLGEHARQMRRGSTFLRALAEAEAARPPALPALSIYTVHDNLVAPQDTSRLEWARNVAVAGLGHIDVIVSERIYPLVLEELRA